MNELATITRGPAQAVTNGCHRVTRPPGGLRTVLGPVAVLAELASLAVHVTGSRPMSRVGHRFSRATP